MIQLNKEPVYNDQLKFNLDSSTPTSSKYGLGSPGVIIYQKLSPKHKSKAITTSKVYNARPISDKLSLAMKMAKLDASNYLRKSKEVVEESSPKKAIMKKTNPDCKNTSKPQSKVKFSKTSYHWPLRQPQAKSKGIRFNKASFKQPVWKRSSELFEPKRFKQEQFKAVKNTCTSTYDLNNVSESQNKSRHPVQTQAKNNFSPVVKTKVEKKKIPKTPVKDFGVPYYITPEKERLSSTPIPVNEKVLIRKNNKFQDEMEKLQYGSKPEKKCIYDQPNKTSTKQSHNYDNFCAPTLQQRPSERRKEKPPHGKEVEIRSMYERLLDMEDLERNIRNRWVEVKYDRLRKSDKKQTPNPCINTPEKPTVIDITGGLCASSKPKKEPFKFVSKKRPIESPGVHFTNFPVSKKAQKTLFLPTKTVESIYRNKSAFSDYLRQTLHEPKGNFDPWNIVDDLSDEVVRILVNDVCNEVSSNFDDCIDLLFENEFAEPESEAKRTDR